jgi:hypothetical protein
LGVPQAGRFAVSSAGPGSPRKRSGCVVGGSRSNGGGETLRELLHIDRADSAVKAGFLRIAAACWRAPTLPGCFIETVPGFSLLVLWAWRVLFDVG